MDLDEIVKLATDLHSGQMDKSGRPYIGHAERVASMVRASGGNWAQEAAAWLHDTIEDTGTTGEKLHSLGVPGLIIHIVETLTHLPNESNAEYWHKIKVSPSAVLVKLCDIYDNLSPARLCYLDPETQNRLRIKYSTAMLHLLKEE